ncbi:MAG: FAD binding domain-containing protein [Clostridiales bacterium]|nr:FAD binding domain-containing protein [Clostridiales bacterium]
MKIDSYLKAESIEEAYKVLKENNDAAIIAGGAWLKLMPKTIGIAVDLKDLGLNEITETDNEIILGCMATLRQVEKYKPLQEQYDGIVSKSASSIMGVTVRNIATIGGTISGKYGFSDMIPVLMAVDAELNFYKRGRVKLSEFMEEKGFAEDILTHVYIKKAKSRGWFETMKNTAIDFPILNSAITKSPEGYRIVIGSRPYKAVNAIKSMEFINDCKAPGADEIAQAADIAIDEIKFGKNQRGSEEYRKELCRTFVKRGLTAVIS